MVDRVSLNYCGAPALGEFYGGGDEGLRDAVAAQSANDEEAGERLDVFFRRVGFGDRNEAAIGRAGCDRTPGDRLVVEVAEDADGCAGVNALLQCGFAAGAVGMFCLRRSGAPDHAPT